MARHSYRVGKGSNQYATKPGGSDPIPARSETRACAHAVQENEAAPVEVDAYHCEACGEDGLASEVVDDALYECGRCGQVFGGGEGNRCPDCRVFASKLGTGVCPDCDSGPVELVARWGINTPEEGWVLEDSPEEALAEAAKVTERNTPEAKAAAAAKHAEMIAAIDAKSDARRDVFAAAAPDITTAFTAVNATADELEQFLSPWAADSHTQGPQRETFVGLCQLAAPDVAPAEIEPTVVDADPDSAFFRVRSASVLKADAYRAAVPQIAVALERAGADAFEVEAFTDDFASESMSASLQTPTFLGLVREAASRARG